MIFNLAGAKGPSPTRRRPTTPTWQPSEPATTTTDCSRKDLIRNRPSSKPELKKSGYPIISSDPFNHPSIYIDNSLICCRSFFLSKHLIRWKFVLSIFFFNPFTSNFFFFPSIWFDESSFCRSFFLKSEFNILERNDHVVKRLFHICLQRHENYYFSEIGIQLGT